MHYWVQVNDIFFLLPVTDVVFTVRKDFIRSAIHSHGDCKCYVIIDNVARCKNFIFHNITHPINENNCIINGKYVSNKQILTIFSSNFIHRVAGRRRHDHRLKCDPNRSVILKNN